MNGPRPLRYFLSHSSHDAALVEGIRARLEAQGIDCWMAPRDIDPGADYDEAILEAIDQATGLIIFLSKHSNESDQVKHEVEHAASANVRIIPARLAAVKPSRKLALHISIKQWVDLFGKSEEAELSKLISFIRPAGATGSVPPPLPPATLVRTSAGIVKVPIFHCGPVVPLEHFINRESELERAESIIRSGQSFLLVGNLRSGKTSFCRRLERHLLSTGSPTILPAQLNVQECHNLTVETFLENTLLALLADAARYVFRIRKYGDLLQPQPTDTNEHLRNDSDFPSFLQIFRQVRERTHDQGASSPAPLRPGEFNRFLRDLLEICRSRGWRRFVMFFDEANRLPRDLSVDLFVSNEEALNAAGLQSVYSSSPTMAEMPQIRESFGKLEIGPFLERTCLQRLLSRYYWDDEGRVEELPLRAGAIDLLWDLSYGVPFVIQLLADRAFALANARGASLVEEAHIQQGWDNLRSERATTLEDALRSLRH